MGTLPLHCVQCAVTPLRLRLLGSSVGISAGLIIISLWLLLFVVAGPAAAAVHYTCVASERKPCIFRAMCSFSPAMKQIAAELTQLAALVSMGSLSLRVQVPNNHIVSGFRV